LHTRWSMTAVAATILGAGLCAGCMLSPSGPTVLVLPATGKPFEQFQADVDACRSWAAQQTKGAYMDAPTYEVQRRYDNAYVQCMYAKGNQVPGRAPATPAASPTPPAGTPPPPPPPAPTR
jgi:hypothetical protein